MEHRAFTASLLHNSHCFSYLLLSTQKGYKSTDFVLGSRGRKKSVNYRIVFVYSVVGEETGTETGGRENGEPKQANAEGFRAYRSRCGKDGGLCVPLPISALQHAKGDAQSPSSSQTPIFNFRSEWHSIHVCLISFQVCTCGAHGQSCPQSSLLQPCCYPSLPLFLP